MWIPTTQVKTCLPKSQQELNKEPHQERRAYKALEGVTIRLNPDTFVCKFSCDSIAERAKRKIIKYLTLKMRATLNAIKCHQIVLNELIIVKIFTSRVYCVEDCINLTQAN